MELYEFPVVFVALFSMYLLGLYIGKKSAQQKVEGVGKNGRLADKI